VTELVYLCTIILQTLIRLPNDALAQCCRSALPYVLLDGDALVFSASGCDANAARMTSVQPLRCWMASATDRAASTATPATSGFSSDWMAFAALSAESMYRRALHTSQLRPDGQQRPRFSTHNGHESETAPFDTLAEIQANVRRAHVFTDAYRIAT
jgi:hypothetical protein